MSGQVSLAQNDRSQSQHFHQHFGIPQVDSGAVTPTNTMTRQAYSMPAIPMPDGSDRTQEAFYKGAFPRSMGPPQPQMTAEAQDIHRQGLKKYAGNVDRAFSSYADAG